MWSKRAIEKSLRIAVGLMVAVAVAYFRPDTGKAPLPQPSSDAVVSAIQTKRALRFVELPSTLVVKVLPTDNYGSRHQKWISRLADGTTVLVAHNIDLSSPVPLKSGDVVDVAGELIFSEQTGKPLIHWTHADPAGRRRAGYIRHRGKLY